jgi:hypothetical protein
LAAPYKARSSSHTFSDTRPITLFRDLDATTPHLVGQLAAVLGGAETLELDVDGIERVVFARLADRCVDDLLAVLLAFRAELGRQVNILEPAPARNVEAKDVLEVHPLLNPLLHHLGERWSALRVQARLAGVRKLVNDLDAVLLGPFANLVALNGDRVLLPVLKRRGRSS